MSDFEFELDQAGIRELMQSGEMLEIVTEYGNRILAQCGEGYEIKAGVGETRAGVIVHPTNPHAYYSNRKHHTLQKALGGMIGGE